MHGRRPDDGGRALGIHFDTLPAVSRLILRGYLRRLPPTEARREPPLFAARAREDAKVDYAETVRRILEARD